MIAMNRLTLRTAMLSIVSVIASIAAPTKAQAPLGTSFFDDLNSINTTRWYVSDGWVNGDHQGCMWSRDQVRTANGKLQLRLTKSANKLRAYKCGEIRTRSRFGYGLYEARMRTAAGSGLNTAMFTYSGPPLTKVHDELDFEFIGKAPNLVELNYWVNRDGAHGTKVPVPGGASSAFNNYAIDWSPNSIKWYINGQLVRTATGSNLPVTPGQYFLTLWSGSSIISNWLGQLPTTTTSAKAVVDWVAYTAPGEKCRFAQSMSC